MVVLVLVLVGFGQAWGATRGPDDYRYWFESYLTRFQECHTTMSPQDKADLRSLLDLKPVYGAGRQYNLWFVKGFCAFLEECLPVLDNGEREKVEFLFQAMPDLEGSQASYQLYLQYVVQQITDFLPVLDEAERTCFGYFRRALPKSTDADYQKWLGEYNRLKQEFGPSYSEAENTSLKLMTDIRPASNPAGEVFQVKGETLLRIRQLILNQQPAAAVSELDRILAGQ